MSEIISKKQYNYCLDFIKGVACICVVFLHCEFPGTLGIAVQAISRWTMPFFFMVSGYYAYYDRSNGYKNNAPKKIKHIATIILFAVIAHFIFYSVYNHFEYDISVKDIFVFLVFNQPFAVDGALWFLFALLYTYFLYAVVNKFNLYKLAYVAAFILLGVFIFLGQGMHLLGNHLPNFIYRNFLLEGFPCFMLGHFIHHKQDKISANNAVLIFVMLVSTGLCLVERYLIGRDFGINICSFPQVIAIFLLGVNNSGMLRGAVQNIGKKARCMYTLFINRCGTV